MELPAVPVEESRKGARLGRATLDGALVGRTGSAYRSARGCQPVGREEAIRFGRQIIALTHCALARTQRSPTRQPFQSSASNPLPNTELQLRDKENATSR